MNVLSESFLRKARNQKDILSPRLVRWRFEDRVLQWLWFISSVDSERIGYGRGPLTWLRQRKHKGLRRRIHICLLEHNPKGWKANFGEPTAFWINERSRACSASVNEGIEDADIVWLYSQDPLGPEAKSRVLQSLKRAKPGTPVVNNPDVYDSYHQARVFKELAEAGVSVPRTEFGDDDLGKTWVVHKPEGRQSVHNVLSKYTGPRAGYRTYEFVDSRGSDGLYRTYRACYLLGEVLPQYGLSCERWEARARSKKCSEHTFAMTAVEISQLRLIAKTLGLEYFAADYLRRESDGLPVFVDINIYPQPLASMGASRKLGYYGRWFIFDAYERLSGPDPSRRPFWDVFDEAMLSLAPNLSRESQAIIGYGE